MPVNSAGEGPTVTAVTAALEVEAAMLEVVDAKMLEVEAGVPDVLFAPPVTDALRSETEEKVELEDSMLEEVVATIDELAAADKVVATTDELVTTELTPEVCAASDF